MLPPPLSPARLQSRNGWYERKEDIPAPAADKPYLKHGGTVDMSSGNVLRYFTVNAKCMTLSTGRRFYILAFSAHKTTLLQHPPGRLV